MESPPVDREVERLLWMRLHNHALLQLLECQVVLLPGDKATPERRAKVLAFDGGSVDLVLDADSPWRADAQAQMRLAAETTE